MRVFACYVVSKLQRHRCPTFGALRLRTRRVETGHYIFIYIDIYFCASNGVQLYVTKVLCKILEINKKKYEILN
jgi:hypothetical protein